MRTKGRGLFCTSTVPSEYYVCNNFGTGVEPSPCSVAIVLPMSIPAKRAFFILYSLNSCCVCSMICSITYCFCSKHPTFPFFSGECHYSFQQTHFLVFFYSQFLAISFFITVENFLTVKTYNVQQENNFVSEKTKMVGEKILTTDFVSVGSFENRFFHCFLKGVLVLQNFKMNRNTIICSSILKASVDFLKSCYFPTIEKTKLMSCI